VIEAFTENGFERVGEAFEENFSERGEIGASAAVFHRGEVVAHLRGGTADGTHPWNEDTVVLTYSTTKPLVAACVLLLWDRGELELGARVSVYWPEFGQAGKDGVTVRQMLTHQAGLVALRRPLPATALYEREPVIRALEEEEPWWEPGTRSGEHAYFYGHLIDELVRRVDGRALHDYFAHEIADPWGLDFHIGLAYEDMDRSAVLFDMERVWPDAAIGDDGSLLRLALTNPPGALDPDVVNSEEWKAAAVPAINGYGTAIALARFYQGFLGRGVLDGVQLFSDAAVREATAIHSSGTDVLLERHVDWGIGFQIEGDYFGHGGIGGSSAHAARDLPDLRVRHEQDGRTRPGRRGLRRRRTVRPCAFGCSVRHD